MNSEKKTYAYGNKEFEISIVRRERKTLAIEVLPDSSIRAISPNKISDTELSRYIRKRLKWIDYQKDYFDNLNPRTPSRKYVSGESHLFLEKKFRLLLSSDKHSQVKLKSDFIIIKCRNGNYELASGLLWSWYRNNAENIFNERLIHCMTKFKGYKKPKLVIRKMNKRWGSMKSSNSITLNTDLIRAPIECIDYVITHELCHIEESNHGKKFQRLLERKIPDWREKKIKLEHLLK